MHWIKKWQYVKSVHIRSFSGPYFTVFALNTEKYGVSLRIQSVFSVFTPYSVNAGKYGPEKLRIRALFTEFGQTFFKNLTVFIPQGFQSMFGHFSLLCMKQLIIMSYTFLRKGIGVQIERESF